MAKSDIALIVNTLRFAFAALDGVAFHEADCHADAHNVFDGVDEFFLKFFEGTDFVAKNLRRNLHLNLNLIKALGSGKKDLVVGQCAFRSHKRRFDLRRENINSAYDKHIIAPAANAADAPNGSAAGTGLRIQRSDIMRSIPDYGHGVFAEGCEDQFAFFSIGHRFAGLRVDDLGVKMILKDVEAILTMAFNAHSGANDLRKAIYIIGPDVALRLDSSAHAFGPRLGSKYTSSKRQVFDVDAHFAGPLDEMNKIAWSAAYGCNAKILHDHDLPVGVAPGNGNNGCAQSFGAIVSAKAAREKPIPICVLNNIALVKAA